MAVIIVILLFLLWTNSCKSDSEVITVTVPEVKGEFDPVKPTHTTIYETEYIKVPGSTKTIKEQDTTVINALINENKRLTEAFSQSDNKDSLYNIAIALKAFNTEFDDDNLHLVINGIVRGEVQQLTPSYTIKERKIDVPVKTAKVRVLAGAELGSNLEFNSPAVKGNLMLQNAKGNLFSGSYDSNGRIWVGYNFTLFKF